MSVRPAAAQRERWADRLTAARWYEVARQTLSDIFEDRVPSVAAGITFFGLLAMFPALASIVSLYGMFADRSSIRDLTEGLSPYLPGGAVTVLDTQLHRLVTQPSAKLNFAFVAGFLVAAWSASGGVKALVDGLNIAYETRDRRSFLQLTLTALFFALAGIVLGTAITALGVVIPVELHLVHLPAAFKIFFALLRVPVVYVICVLILDIIYRLGPDRRNERWQWLSWGSGFGAALWIAATLLFAWYVQEFGSYDRVYGNLGAAVGFLTWIWIMLVILLAGAELNCEIERRRREPR